MLTLMDLPVREEGSPSHSPQPAISPSPSPLPQNRPSPSPQPDPQGAENIQAQQEAFRAMLRQAVPEQGQAQQADDVEDPTMKMLASLMGSLPGDPSGAPPGAAAGGPPGGSPPGLSPAAIASAFGLPPFLANMLGGAFQAPTETEAKTQRIWKALHVLFAVGLATYLLFIITTSVSLFGSPPPKPATAQNPFTIFVTGELLLTGGRILFGGKQGGFGMVSKLFKDIVRDSSLVLFALGLGTWYYREWQTVEYYE